MIGDIILDARIAFAKQGRNFPFGRLTVPVGVKGKYAIMDVAKVTTADDVFPLGDIGTIGVVGLANLGAPLIDTPDAPVVTNIGAPGATAQDYVIVAVQADGGYTVASATGSTATGNDTLDFTNFNRLVWSKVDDAVLYQIWRASTTGTTPNTTGLIGTTPTLTFDDNGFAGDGNVAPTTTPFDFQVEIGSDGSLYPILLKGGDVHITRWKEAAIHRKALFNQTDVQFLLIEA